MAHRPTPSRHRTADACPRPRRRPSSLFTDRCAMKVTTASHLVLDFQQNLCKEGNLLCAAVSRAASRASATELRFAITPILGRGLLGSDLGEGSWGQTCYFELRTILFLALHRVTSLRSVLSSLRIQASRLNSVMPQPELRETEDSWGQT